MIWAFQMIILEHVNLWIQGKKKKKRNLITLVFIKSKLFWLYWPLFKVICLLMQWIKRCFQTSNLLGCNINKHVSFHWSGAHNFRSFTLISAHHLSPQYHPFTTVKHVKQLLMFSSVPYGWFTLLSLLLLFCRDFLWRHYFHRPLTQTIFSIWMVWLVNIY